MDDIQPGIPLKIGESFGLKGPSLYKHRKGSSSFWSFFNRLFLYSCKTTWKLYVWLYFGAFRKIWLSRKWLWWPIGYSSVEFWSHGTLWCPIWLPLVWLLALHFKQGYDLSDYICWLYFVNKISDYGAIESDRTKQENTSVLLMVGGQIECVRPSLFCNKVENDGSGRVHKNFEKPSSSPRKCPLVLHHASPTLKSTLLGNNKLLCFNFLFKPHDIY